MAVELLSVHVNEKVHLSLFFTMITLHLFLKAFWISAHYSIGNCICSTQSSILIFRFWADIYFWFIFLCLFALVLLNVISAFFFFSVTARNHFNYEVLTFPSPFWLPNLIPNRKPLLVMEKKGIWGVNFYFLIFNF